MSYMKVVVVAFAIIMMLAGMPASVQAQSETGLVGEWHFDGDAKDSSGNGNDGTINGASFVDGKFGKAMSFDGVDDYVRVLDSASLDVTDGITTEAWVRLSSTRSYGQNIAHKWGDEGTWSDSRSYGLIIVQKKIAFGISDLANQRDTPFHVIATTDTDVLELGKWHYVAGTFDGTYRKIYVDGVLLKNVKIPSNIYAGVADLGIGAHIRSPTSVGEYFNGLIDEVRIYNRALSADEIKAHYEGKQTSLTLTKTASPYSIKQGQTTTITLTIKNTGTTDIANIEVMDSIHRNFDLIGGDFPNPKKYDIIGKGESREIQYMIKAKESGTFTLDPATGIYADKDGNIQEAKSEPFLVKVITSFEPNPIKTSAPASTPEPTTNPVKTASVSLYGEKTDVVLGEDILLKLSAVNLITKPMMHVQVIIIPPSGMSVTSSEFSKIAAGQFTANYELPPGDGRDIEVSIKSNQIGDFNVNGRIIYYFGDEKGTAEDHNLNLPIKVRREAGQAVAAPTPIPTASGFAGEVSIIGILFIGLLIKRRGW